jgi:outer membrane lipoprotein-sorting protein
MSNAPLIVLAMLASLGVCGFAIADDAPVELHAPVPKPRPQDAKDAKPAAPASKLQISAAEAVRRADAWLDSTKTLVADFVQVGPDGHRAEGKLELERPGRVRFQFSPPDRLEIVADGRSIAVRDQKMNTQDLYLIGQTPLKFLLADHFGLAKDTQVMNVDTSSNKAVSIVIEDKATFGGSAQIELLFEPATFALKQWTVSDAQGAQTVTSLFDIDLATKPDESDFEIDEHMMIGPKR